MKKQIKIPPMAKGKILLDWLRDNGVFISAPCGGSGTCGKCRVTVIEGLFLDREAFERGSEKILLKNSGGEICACRAVCTGKASVIEYNAEEAVPNETKRFKSADAAIDIGTTTVAVKISDRDGAGTNDTVFLNPQGIFGADVMSRIQNSEKDGLSKMRHSLCDKINGVFSAISEKIENVTIAGNTTMLHIFCGVSPKSLGQFPFTPVFTESRILSKDEALLNAGKIIVLPSVSAFIGADVLCGALYCKMTEYEKPTLLMDLGTNGEMILCSGKNNGNKFFATSAAAGPALEGAGIECGVGGIPGAISKFSVNEKGNIEFTTIGNETAVGICGSGLIDIVANLLNNGLLDKTACLAEGKYYIEGTDLFVSEKDIRAFQMTKSAIKSAWECLLVKAGVEPDDIEQVFIAGGLGFYWNIESAVVSGLLPKNFNAKAKSVGNSALEGAAETLYDAAKVNELEKMADNCEVFNLGGDEMFNKKFIENIYFD